MLSQIIHCLQEFCFGFLVFLVVHDVSDFSLMPNRRDEGASGASGAKLKFCLIGSPLILQTLYRTITWSGYITYNIDKENSNEITAKIER